MNNNSHGHWQSINQSKHNNKSRLPRGPQGLDRGGGFLHAHVLSRPFKKLPQAEDTSPQGAQVASARCVWLACLAQAVVVCLGPDRGRGLRLAVVLLGTGKSSTTKARLRGTSWHHGASAPDFIQTVSWTILDQSPTWQCYFEPQPQVDLQVKVRSTGKKQSV